MAGPLCAPVPWAMYTPECVGTGVHTFVCVLQQHVRPVGVLPCGAFLQLSLVLLGSGCVHMGRCAWLCVCAACPCMH